MQICIHCGKESRDDDMFCLHCGQRLEASTPVAPQATSETPRGWVWPWQRAGQGDGATGVANTTVDVAVRAQANGSTPNAEPHSLAAGRLILEAADSSGQAHDFVLDGRNVTIGRAPACTVSLPEDQLASRLHAMLHYTGEQYTISDLGSSNGTLVNGVLIRGATPLAEGDRITVGQHTLIYARALGAHAAASVGDHEQVTALNPAQVETAPPAMPDAQDFAAAPDEQAAALPAAGQQWTSTVADSEPSTVSDPESEPDTSPQPTWQHTSADPWVMPAPPQWAEGPGSDVWSAPQEVRVEPQSGAEPAAPAWQRSDERDGSAVSQGDAAPWAIEVNPWNDDADTGEHVAPPWSPPAVTSAQWEARDEPQALGDGSSEAASSLTASAAADVEEGPATGELDVVRTQLVRSSELLSRWTQSTASHTRQLRAELAAVSQDVASVLAEAQGRGAGSVAQLDELVRLAEDAAQDPHHVNTVVALASRSSEVASALKAQRELLAALIRVRDRLNELARQDS
jgi:hypothetical protein